jgi:hypothetical protein
MIGGARATRIAARTWTKPRFAPLYRVAIDADDKETYAVRPVRDGGIVRALMPNGGPLELCDVERLRCASVDEAGNPNGTVVLAYCERSNLYGWVVVGHQTSTAR